MRSASGLSRLSCRRIDVTCCRPLEVPWRGVHTARPRASSSSTGSCYNSSNGGDTFGTPWRLNAQGTGGGPKIEWPKNPAYPLEASPEALHDACVVWERERGDSLPHRQKKTDRAPSVGRPAVALCGGAISSCRVAQKNRGRGVLFVCGIAREFYGGRGTFSVRLNAEGDTPPVGIKRGDGRSNYYNTNLYGFTN